MKRRKVFMGTGPLGKAPHTGSSDPERYEELVMSVSIRTVVLLYGTESLLPWPSKW